MANGFAQSFEKAFVPAAKSSSDATLELLKEKIKKDAEKEAAKTKATSIDVASLQSIEALKKSGVSQDIIDMATASLEVGSSITDPDLKEKNFINQQKMFSTIIANAEKQKAKSAAVDTSNEKVIDLLKGIGLGVQGVQQQDTGSAIVGATADSTTIAPYDMSISVSDTGRLKPTIQPRTADEISKIKMEQEKLRQETSPEFQKTKKQEEAKASQMGQYEVEQIKQADEMSGGMRQTAMRLKQISKAFPASDVPWQQRVKAVLQGKISDAGLTDNAQTFSVQKNLAQAILGLKDSSGMTGVMTEPDRKLLELFAKDISKGNQAERYLAVKDSFVNTIAKMTPVQIERIKQDKNTMEVLTMFDVDPDNLDYSTDVPSTKKSFSSLWS